jgi:hypothetical protein
MSTSGITSSLLSEIASSALSTNQFATDLNQLAQDLQGGNLTAAQADFVTLSQDALNGVTSANSPTGGFTSNLLTAIAASPSGESSFVSELNQLGADLQNGNLSSSLEDLVALESTALGAASTAGATTNTTPTTSTTATDNQSTSQELIQAVVAALGAGDNSIAGVALSALASVSTSSTGASYLQVISAGLANSNSTGAINPTSQLLQSLNTNLQNNAGSILNLLA